MNTRLTKLLTGALVAGVLIGGQVFADYNDLIEKLESKGTLTADEASELKVSQTIIPDNKFLNKMEIRGRVHVQAAFVDAENDAESSDYSTMELRRARLGARASFPGNIRGHIEGNILPGEASLRSAYIQWREHKTAYFKVGYDKPVTSLEEDTSSSAILTVERSNLTNTLAAPGETVGAIIEGKMAPLFYAVGVYNDEDAVRNTAGEQSEYLFNARGGVELELSEGSTVIAQVTYLQSDDPNGNLGGDYEDITIGSIHFESGPFDIRAEYMVGSNEDGDTDGFYIQPSMMLSDKVEIVGRYESMSSDDAEGIRATSRYGRRVDIADGADRGDDFSAIYLGLNYYINGNGSKVMLGVEMNELDNTEAGAYDTTTVFTAWRTLF
jgi:phosphate-selective porin OprO/OprP